MIFFFQNSVSSRFLRAALNGNTQEYAPRGEMYKMLNKQPKGRFDESTTGKYVYQMANALSYCHSKKVRGPRCMLILIALGALIT